MDIIPGGSTCLTGITVFYCSFCSRASHYDSVMESGRPFVIRRSYIVYAIVNGQWGILEDHKAVLVFMLMSKVEIAGIEHGKYRIAAPAASHAYPSNTIKIFGRINCRKVNRRN